MWQAGDVKTWTHKSYRPLTVLTFKVDYNLWGTHGPNFGAFVQTTLVASRHSPGFVGQVST